MTIATVANGLASRFLYTKSHRLRTRADFAQVFDNQIHCLRSRHFVLLVSSIDEKVVRFGVVVSKKVAKKAVVRNRLKRFARESFRLHNHALSTLIAKRQSQQQHGYGLVCIARERGLHKAPEGDEYHASLARLFDQLACVINQEVPASADSLL